MYFLYSLLTAAGLLLLTPYFLIKGIRQKKYLQNLPERFARRFPANWPASAKSDAAGAGAIWVHAVSVGEALAALPLARALKERYPQRRLLISTTTATGQAVARERMTFADAVFYFPLDWPGPVLRALAKVRPELIVIFETEVWPNFLREARRAGVPVVFVNGRISDRSFRRFARALRLSAGMLRGFLRRVLSDAALYLMQSEEDAARLVALGAPGERVLVTGNLKYDFAPPESSPLAAWLELELARSKRGPVLVAGSVIEGEETAVLEAFAAVCRKWPQTLLVLAPRKPERFAAAASLAEQAGWRVVRRSGLSLETASAGALGSSAEAPRSILLLDTIGELASVYRLADAVFIGGSLQPGGGHNPVEPAAFGKAPVFGVSMDNFREIAAKFLKEGAAIQVDSGAALGKAWTDLLADDDLRVRMGLAARAIVERSRGATATTLDHLAAVLSNSRMSR